MTRPSNPVIIDQSARNEATEFLRENVALKAIIQRVRGRFEVINHMLLQANVNKHDLSHQLRVALNSVALMRALNFNHREIVHTGVAGLIHDLGYGNGDPSHIESVGYHAGPKGAFKLHALHGAVQIEAFLHSMLDALGQPDFQPAPEMATEFAAWRELLTFKDETGEPRLLDREGIDRITASVLHHNDFGKDQEAYDPTKIDRAALVTQFCDKVDHISDRTYEAHVRDPELEKDPSGHHKRAPYCITDYHFSVPPKGNMIHVIYQVDPERLAKIIPGYDDLAFRQDFIKAYGDKTLPVAAEAAGRILECESDKPTLLVELVFKSGAREAIPFARPERSIYREKLQTTMQPERTEAVA